MTGKAAIANTTNSGSLAGRRTVVLGAGSGIGRAVVSAYLAAGAKVLAFDISAKKCTKLEADFPQVRTITGDATHENDVQKLARLCIDQGWDGVDALVSCVGLFDFYQGLEDIPPKNLSGGFDQIMRVNVLSNLLAAQVFLPLLRKARGTMIFTSSSSGFFPGRGGILYLTSKFAIRGSIAALAHELAPDIRVNGVAPGGVTGTDLRGAASLGLEEMRVPTGDGRDADLKNLTPLELAMTTDEIAQSYVFLASDGARGMTGTFLHPDGGMGIRG